MNRPLSPRSTRPRTAPRPPPGRRPNPPVRPQPPSGGRSLAPDSGRSAATTFMLWVLIIYLVVPVNYLTGDMRLDNTLGMAAPNPLARTIKLGLLAMSAVILISKSRAALLEMKFVNPFFWAFMGLVPLSVLWSVAPEATINRYVSLWSIVSVCYAFTVIGWGRTRFQDVLRPIVTALLIGSVLFGMMYPQYAIETGEGTLKDAWRGLADQKNQFGMLASFGAVLWLHAGLSREKPWWLALPFLCLSFVCVMLSRSSTSLLATSLSTLFMLLVMVAPSSLRRLLPYVVSSFAVIVVLYALTVLNLIPGISILLEPLADLVGKDLTFSNRAVIWGIIKEHIQLAPMLGSGYGAFWTGPVPTSPSYIFIGRMYFYPTQSHNGYLEIVNDLGFVGLAVLLGYLVYWVRQSLNLLKFDRSQALLFLALFFQQAVTNLTESTWLAINSAFAIAVATLATFSLARALLDLRARAQSAPPRPGGLR